MHGLLHAAGLGEHQPPPEARLLVAVRVQRRVARQPAGLLEHPAVDRVAAEGPSLLGEHARLAAQGAARRERDQHHVHRAAADVHDQGRPLVRQAQAVAERRGHGLVDEADPAHAEPLQDALQLGSVGLEGRDRRGDHEVADALAGRPLDRGEQLAQVRPRQHARRDGASADARERPCRLARERGLEGRHEARVHRVAVAFEREPADQRAPAQEHPPRDGRPAADPVDEPRASRAGARPTAPCAGPRADRRARDRGRRPAAPRAAAGRSPRPSARCRSSWCRDRGPSRSSRPHSSRVRVRRYHGRPSERAGSAICEGSPMTSTVLSAVVLAVTAAAAAEPSHPFSVHDMLAMQRISDPRVSPDAHAGRLHGARHGPRGEPRPDRRVAGRARRLGGAAADAARGERLPGPLVGGRKGPLLPQHARGLAAGLPAAARRRRGPAGHAPAARRRRARGRARRPDAPLRAARLPGHDARGDGETAGGAQGEEGERRRLRAALRAALGRVGGRHAQPPLRLPPRRTGGSST